VIGRDPTTWWRSVLIDYGSRQGAHTNQTVMTADGLVGRIRSVQPTFSQVALIGDPECGVSVVINETREPGTIQEARSANLGDGLITMHTLQHSATVMAGQSVSTLGNGGVFPKGIPVGKIVDTRSVDGGLSTEVRLHLFAQLNRLEEVWVLTP
jgi:rod shape-determining protein MreC